MKRSKIIPILIVISMLGILISSFIPTIAAYQWNNKVNKRSIEDWLTYNVYVGAHVDFGKALVLAPHIDLTDPNSIIFIPISQCSYGGFILERTIEGNKLSVTVLLEVFDAPFSVRLLPVPPLVCVFAGVMYYRWYFNFIIDLELYPEDHFDENGNVLFDDLFNFLGNPEGMGVDLKYIFLYGCGEGTFVESWDSWEAGDEAKMKVMMCYLWKGEFLNHPKYNLYGLGELVAIDYISFW